ncbi:hypothetical protein [Acidocella sp.]|uniref:hypothetical protein n=1 Tax=Acidocella sp. TaxID=50710 RepID=UPI002605500D|nr:hypothetical protein [Acidocella sp.]
MINISDIQKHTPVHRQIAAKHKDSLFSGSQVRYGSVTGEPLVGHTHSVEETPLLSSVSLQKASFGKELEDQKKLVHQGGRDKTIQPQDNMSSNIKSVRDERPILQSSIDIPDKITSGSVEQIDLAGVSESQNSQRLPNSRSKDKIDIKKTFNLFEGMSSKSTSPRRIEEKNNIRNQNVLIENSGSVGHEIKKIDYTKDKLSTCDVSLIPQQGTSDTYMFNMKEVNGTANNLASVSRSSAKITAVDNIESLKINSHIRGDNVSEVTLNVMAHGIGISKVKVSISNNMIMINVHSDTSRTSDLRQSISGVDQQSSLNLQYSGEQQGASQNSSDRWRPRSRQSFGKSSEYGIESLSFENKDVIKYA